MISVLILTRNEEANLPACLEAVKWSDDIVVFDSHSTDRTVEIARAAGARVIQRHFDNERSHRAASLHVGFKHPWVYNPDADEITPPALRDEMLQAVADPACEASAFLVRFKTMFRGRWIRHASLYPTWVARLFKPDKISLERTINLRYIVKGSEGRLQNHFEHYTFNKGMPAWREKHARYAECEALENLRVLEGPRFTWAKLLDRSPVIRRRALKELSFRMPCRPFLRFLYMYVVRLGFMDGRPGLDYCLLLSWYERLIVLRTRELRRPFVVHQHVPSRTRT